MSEMTVAVAFQVATDHHRAGRIEEARALYNRILDVAPNEAGVLGALAVRRAGPPWRWNCWSGPPRPIRTCHRFTG